jgi:glutamate synthase (NADPH) large chain
LDLSPILSTAGVAAAAPRYCETERNAPFDQAPLAKQLWQDLQPAIEQRLSAERHYHISNRDRSIGGALAGEIAKRYGNHGYGDARLLLRFEGNAGQSFGVWNTTGLHLHLLGDANDYVGKGMAGGQLVLAPPDDAGFEARQAPIMGNTCLYGATGGELFAAGTAGERFAVRNSGAVAVIEGAGDHCCEYMTGGVVCVLGRTGVNFGAGFTGGFAYVLDLERDFVDRYNHELVDIHRMSLESTEQNIHHLHGLLATHVALTHSRWGQEILADFRAYLGKFWLVKPKAAAINSLIEHLRRAA